MLGSAIPLFDKEVNKKLNRTFLKNDYMTEDLQADSVEKMSTETETHYQSDFTTPQVCFLIPPQERIKNQIPSPHL